MLNYLKNFLTRRFKKVDKALEYFYGPGNRGLNSPDIRYLASRAEFVMLKHLPDEDLPLIINYPWINKGLKEIYKKRLTKYAKKVKLRSGTKKEIEGLTLNILLSIYS